MGALLAGMVPQALRGVELRRIGWQQEDLDLPAMSFEPIPHLRLLVIGGVVLD